MERERKIKLAKEREKKRFFPALSLALVFARAPLSERLEQATCVTKSVMKYFDHSVTQSDPNSYCAMKCKRMSARFVGFQRLPAPSSWLSSN